MTFQAQFTVTDVGAAPAPIEVLAKAEGENIVANTEGKVSSMELRIVLDEETTVLKAGDIITAGGHFVGLGSSTP